MKPAELLARFQDLESLRQLMDWLQNPPGGVLGLGGLAGSSPALVAAAGLEASGAEGTARNHVFVLQDKETAAYFHNDLSNFLKAKDLLFLPSSYKRSVQYIRRNKDQIVQRTEILQQAAADRVMIVTFPEALVEKIASHSHLDSNAFDIRKGDRLSLSFLAEFLESFRFRLTDFVFEPGQYAIRGSIIDVFSFAHRYPHRIDFFGEQVDSIRTFDIESQRSIETLEQIRLIPHLAEIQDAHLVPLPAFLGPGTVWWTADLPRLVQRMDEIYHHVEGEREGETSLITDENKADYLISGSDFSAGIRADARVEFGQGAGGADSTLHFFTAPQPAFNKNFELLGEDLKHRQEEGYETIVLSDNAKQLERLKAIFGESSITFGTLPTTLHEGFIEHDLKVCLYTDHQIFDRYHRYRMQEHFTRRESLTIRELTGLKPGDYVVHIDHGIARFGGLEKIRLNEREQEAVKLVFRDQDTLYVSIHSLHRISKYKGKDNEPPRIYKLGSGAWQKLKNNTKKKVRDIARELIELYARRKAQQGFAFSADSYLQTELEASFMYEDTEDQWKATREMKEGMEASHPMDRLICGDVGFGKTEVAIRGAFKAVSDSKQVAVLVPTTILALQHFKTFSDRLKDFPCNIDYVSRLKPPVQQKQSLARLKEGKTDIIIGTHRLVSKDVHFKDLGLLIIDEEQKFGVSVKEKLRAMKLNVDTMTLTATPIPRTLQLSLMGARDLSIIRTPPPNRYPIVTELHNFNEAIIKEAVYYEVNRGGQVFFIHNRIQNITEVEALVRRLCPDVKTVYAHGKMEGRKLERIMLDFIEGSYDVLVSTTIIESGLDIPNANTMIINNAHHFGLSDLHQLRGRVGRSNRKAFCYLLAPPLTLQTPEARRRLKAIEEFSEIGSGLNIALQDLDIRGAGNLLGAEQSGFIAEIGFETYHRILDEALLELREGEYKSLFADADGKSSRTERFITDCQIDTDLSLLLPDEYIEHNAERLRLYQVLDSLQTEEELAQFAAELADRFGPPPPESLELLDVVRLRWLAIELGFEKIILKQERMIIHFIGNPESGYFNSPVFQQILQFVQQQGRKYTLKESRGRLRLSTGGVRGIADALDRVRRIHESVNA